MLAFGQWEIKRDRDRRSGGRENMGWEREGEGEKNNKQITIKTIILIYKFSLSGPPTMISV